MKYLILLLIIILSFSVSANAELYNRGTDILGNRLIYDSDLDVTWYDYMNSYSNWYTQMDWASALTVNFRGTIYDDWRLPATVDGSTGYRYDGTSSHGYNNTSSEMGHLFYIELGNTGAYDTSGNQQSCWGDPLTRPNSCLINTGDFQNLQSHYSLSGTDYAAATGNAWTFDFAYGSQGPDLKFEGYGYAIAVRAGDVAVVPEPISSTLMIFGGSLLGLKRFRKKFSK